MTYKPAAAFAALSVLWGLTYLFVKVAVDGGVPPAGVAFLRVAVAAAILLAPSARRRGWAALRRHWPALTVFALVDIAVPFLLVAIAERHVDSSLAAIVTAASPLLLITLGVAVGGRARPSGRQLGGLVVGFAGVGVLVGVGGSAGPWPPLALGASALGYAVGPLVLERWLAGVDTQLVMGAALLLSAVILAPAALVTAPPSLPSASALVAVGAAGVLCTATAYALYGFLIRAAGADRAIVVTYVNPLIAVIVAVPVLGERPGPSMLAGLLLILSGSWAAVTSGRSTRGAWRGTWSSSPASCRHGSGS